MAPVPEPPGHPEPAKGILASDAARDETLATLNDATAEGRLTLEELVGRVDTVLRARTRGELTALTSDLPAQAAPTDRAKPTRWLVGILGGLDIVVPEGLVVDLGGFAIIGANDLESPGPEPAADAPTVRVRAYSLMGGTNVKTKPSRSLTHPTG